MQVSSLLSAKPLIAKKKVRPSATITLWVFLLKVLTNLIFPLLFISRIKEKHQGEVCGNYTSESTYSPWADGQI